MKYSRHYTLLLALLPATMALAAQRDVRVSLPQGTAIVTPLADNAVRIRYGEPSQLPELTYMGDAQRVKYKVVRQGDATRIILSRMSVLMGSMAGDVVFFDADGKPVLSELNHQAEASRVQDESTYITTATFDSPADEHLYGLGQFQDGAVDVRGLSRRLTQVNTQISMPMVISSRGYGLLWNNYGLTYFNPCSQQVRLQKGQGGGLRTEVDVTGTEGTRREVRQDGAFRGTITVDEEGDYALLLDVGQTMARRHHLNIDGIDLVQVNNVWLPPTTSVITHLTAGTHQIEARLENNDRPTLYYNKVTNTTTFRSPVSEAVDYTVFVGNADDVVASYRHTTGDSPMLPDWAFGYVHCRERFHSSDEILQTAHTMRQKELPMDVIVQDWQWWGKYGWNAMKFDERYYPDPKLLVDSLHSMGARLMLSVWSKVDGNSDLGKEIQKRGYYIPGTTWIDFFNEDAAKFYWDNFSQKMLQPYGIDSWWQDATEPENDDLLNRKINAGKTPGEIYRNTYPNLVSRTVYEGSRQDAPEHRTLILTRSGAPGIHRYGSFLWSGDVGHDWQTLRYQLAGGLGLAAAGHPWWTYDAGGFFRPQGQYNDPAYHERFLRWLQLSTFLPMMRVHGYMTDTEFWRFGPMVETEARAQLQLRYRLFPYIYTLAHDVSKGASMMRPFVMDFADDKTALTVSDQYMFGRQLMVAPVLDPQIVTRNTYLPYTPGGWYHLHTGKRYTDMRMYQQIPVDIHGIPVFVRAGSILPQALPMQSTATQDRDNLIITVYPGADGSFDLYEDEGVNYNYEKGAYSVIPMQWSDATRTLTLDRRTGSFAGMSKVRHIHVLTPDGADHCVEYNGQGMTVKL